MWYSDSANNLITCFLASYVKSTRITIVLNVYKPQYSEIVPPNISQSKQKVWCMQTECI